jgi:hypothetical protein
MKKMISILAIAGLVLALAPNAQAAVITWGTPADTINENVIINASTVVQAYNCGLADNYTVTVGGSDVSFTGVAKSTAGPFGNFNNGESGADFWQGTAIDPDFNTVMDSGFYTNAGVTIGLTGLVNGQEYEVQIFSADNRSAAESWNRKFAYKDAEVGSAFSTPGLGFKDGVGQYVVGSFTAAGTTQDIIVDGSLGTKQMNALVLTVPAGTSTPGTLIFVQ